MNSSKPPPCISESKEFEDGLVSMIESIHFRETKNSFHNIVKCNKKKTKNDNHLLVPFDKTSNFYRVKKEKSKHYSVKAYKVSVKK